MLRALIAEFANGDRLPCRYLNPSRPSCYLAWPNQKQSSVQITWFDSGEGSTLLGDSLCVLVWSTWLAKGRFGFRHPPQHRPSPEQGCSNSLPALGKLAATVAAGSCWNESGIFGSAEEFIRFLPLSSGVKRSCSKQSANRVPSHRKRGANKLLAKKLAKRGIFSS